LDINSCFEMDLGPTVLLKSYVIADNLFMIWDMDFPFVNLMK